MNTHISEWSATRNSLGVAVIAGMVLLASAAAFAQQADEINVTAPRMVERSEVSRSSTGLRVEEISLTRRVSLEGFDLTKVKDVAEIEKRIDDAAYENCKQLDTLYPLPLPTDNRKQCAEKASSKAKSQLKALTIR